MASKHPAAYLGEHLGWGIEARPIEGLHRSCVRSDLRSRVVSVVGIGQNGDVTNVAEPKHLAHFATIAAAEEAEEEARIRRACETPPGERMLAGVRLGAALPWNPAVLAEVDARADGQMELARRRIALGIRR